MACQTPTLFVNFTVDSVVTLRAGVSNSIINLDTLGALDDQQSRPEAVATSVLYALGIDVLASVFFWAPEVPATATVTNTSASSLWAEWDPLASADLPIVLSGLASPAGSYFQSNNEKAFDGLTPTARQAIQNYAIALHSAILLDLGSTVVLPHGNILTNLTALKSRIQTSKLVGTLMTPTNGSANGVHFTSPAAPYLVNHTSAFRLPISLKGSSRLVQRYLCRRMVLKPTLTLGVDVLVATVSMFMLGWAVVQFGMMYFAKGHSSNG